MSIGETVNNAQIVEQYQCSPQGGMRRSYKTNTLVLVSNHVVKKSKIYDDKKIDGIYHYTGMGRHGDQDIHSMQNKTLAESLNNGVSVHFFEVFKEGAYIYMGQAKLAAKPYQETQDDADGVPRQVWMFPLLLLNESNPSSYVDKELLKDLYKDQEKLAESMGMDELRKRAMKSGAPSSSRKVNTKTYLRNPYIAEYTKRRANGICQLCEQAAPFQDRDKKPYLESHHIIWLSKKGPDEIRNTIALCPNCHKKMHVRNETTDIEKLQALNKSLSLV